MCRIIVFLAYAYSHFKYFKSTNPANVHACIRVLAAILLMDRNASGFVKANQVAYYYYVELCSICLVMKGTQFITFALVVVTRLLSGKKRCAMLVGEGGMFIDIADIIYVRV